MLATVTVLRHEKHQLANRQFALDASSGTVLGTFPDWKVSNAMDMILDVPYSAALERANLVTIGSRVYDVMAIDNITYAERQTRMLLRLNVVSTYLRMGQGVAGWFERTPTKQIPNGRVQVADDTQMYAGKVAELRKLPMWGTGPSTWTQAVYIQIASKYDIQTQSSSALTMYATFAPYRQDIMSAWPKLRFADRAGNNLPNLPEVMTDLDQITGIPADSIVDIAVSIRCPYKAQVDTNGPIIVGRDGNVIHPVNLSPQCSLYVLGKQGMGANAATDLETNPGVVGVQLSDYERMCGKLFLVDDYNNPLCEIPMDYLDANNYWYCNQWTYDDITGIYTLVDVNGKYFTVTSGHLPWIGDAWNDYRSRTLAYDREALSRGVSNVREQQNIDNINAVAGGLMTSAMGMASNPAGALLGVAQMGLGVVTSGMQADLAVKDLYASQAAKEALVKNSPSPNFQTSYGLDYCYRAYDSGGAHILLQMPANFNATDFANYIAYRGWPCNKYASFNLAAGYIKGNIYQLPSYAPIANGPGPELDTLRREIAQGCRLVTN